MSQGDPEDDGQPADSAGVSARFDAIVAGLRAEGAVPSWPDDKPTEARSRVDAPEVDPQPDPAEGEDHFVPPEPPPLPALGRAAAVGVGLLALGMVLMLTPETLGMSESVGLPLGLVSLAGGLGWLVLRSWSADPPADDGGSDDGAVL